MLTEKQQKVFDDFLYKIEQKDTKSCLLPSEERGIGKTYMLNELAFTLQALGYIVYVLTPYKEQEYFAHKFISNSSDEIKGMNRESSVIIVDEEKYNPIVEFIRDCDYREIPVVGYVNCDL